ncbi:outer membrane beta-barrel protein [uncultured Muribaculum sp.]|uniref:outer membrane beta-barrel protein n=1 Tax=uncultured Muribaculum sp. TaxID=1918613 RepID=UPI0025F4D7CB|nr:outer membrane beta-barrel protein [uncultured Muribaculum sp.]
MKKIICALMMLVGAVSAMQAQTEITASYGAYTQMDAMDCHDGGPSVNTAWGALNAGINFHVAPGFWIGPSYTFSSTSRKRWDDNKFYYHAIMLNVRYNYYRNSIVTMYAKGGLGSVITHQTWPDDSKNKAYCAFQINPICAQVGLSNVITMFGELGFGAQGLLQVGVKIAL